MGLDEYYDDALTNTIWWLDTGFHKSDDATQGIVFYLYDQIMLGNTAHVGAECVPIIVGNNNPVMIWVTDRELIFIDARGDKQNASFDALHDFASYALESLCSHIGVSSDVIKTHTLHKTYPLCLGIEKETYTITLHHVTFSFSMLDTLSYWKQWIMRDLDDGTQSQSPLEPV